jgi:hypothetical protein
MELYLHSPYAFMAWCSVKRSTGTTLPLPLQMQAGLNLPDVTSKFHAVAMCVVYFHTEFTGTYDLSPYNVLYT